MSLLTEKKFSFTSSAPGLTQDTFTVIRFKGYEAISKPYEFEIMLVSDNMNIDLANVLQNPAKFTIHRDNGDDVDFNGILAQFEELREFNGYIFFRALLVPKLWWLSLTHHNQVCLNNSVPEIIENTLKDGGLFQNLDFDFNLQNNYPKIDYVCQYGETHFNFVSRWVEREGIYYFFKQTKKGEKIIFTDTKIVHSDLPQETTLFYAPPSGLDSLHLEEAIKAFTCRYQMLPKKVFLKDYNYERPSLGIEGSAEVDKKGRGEKYIYGEHFPTPEEGNRLAAIRAEELLCRKIEFFGESSVPYMMPGYIFKLEDHYRDAFNSRYLITEVTHEGHQTGFLYSGIGEELSETEQKMVYENRFKAITEDVQFRPEKKSIKPKVSGTINAWIDTEGDGRFAELDSQGRYKIRLPFDVNDTHKDGKASAYVRMMQPSAGENQGMHFPLHSRTEVLLAFIDGDPDRPIITGAVPNPETSSPVTGSNQTKSVISTGKGSETHSVGAEYARQPNAEYHADNYIEFEDASKEHIRISSIGDIWLEANERYGDYHVGQPDNTPIRTATTDPPKIGDMLAKFGTDYNPSNLFNRHNRQTQTFNDAFQTGHIHVSSFDTFKIQEGNIYNFRGYWKYNMGNSYVENHIYRGSYQDSKNNTVNLNLNHPWDQDKCTGPNTNIKCNDLDLSGGLTAPRFEWIWELEGADFHNSGAPPSFSKTLDPNMTWVEKNLGGAKYNYTKATQTLNVEVGTAVESHIYGRASYEYKYSKGKLISKTASKAGHIEEWKYDRVTGVILSHDKKDWWGVSGNIISSSFSLGNKIYSNISLGNKTYSDISLSGEEYFKFNGSLKMGIDVGIGMTIGLKTGVGFDFEADLKPSYKLKKAKGSFKLHGPGTKLKKEEALKAKEEGLVLSALKTGLEKKNVHFESGNVQLIKSELTVKMGQLLEGL